MEEIYKLAVQLASEDSLTIVHGEEQTTMSETANNINTITKEEKSK